MLPELSVECRNLGTNQLAFGKQDVIGEIRLPTPVRLQGCPEHFLTLDNECSVLSQCDEGIDECGLGKSIRSLKHPHGLDLHNLGNVDTTGI